MKCKGLIGWLLGHKYKIIYDTDIEYHSAEEKKKLLAEVNNYNCLHLIERADPDMVNNEKRITKVYKGHICTRCGHKINDETIKL